MYPACQICGKPTKTVNSEYCQGTYWAIIPSKQVGNYRSLCKM